MLFIVGIDTVDDVLEIRTKALEQLKAGGSVVTSWSSENTSVTKTQGVSLTKLLEETALFLRQVDPSLYGRLVKRSAPFYTSF